MSLTVSIVVHNTPQSQLQKALEAVLRYPVDKIFIMENSPRPYLESITGLSDRIHYSHIENKGYGNGHNLAIQKILNSSDYHLVMNADVWWEGEILRKLTDFLDKNPDVGMIMPKVYYPDGELQYACRMLPTPLDLLAKRFLPSFLTKKRMERFLLAVHDHDKPLNVPYLLGSFLLFRVKALQETGLFDERFFMYPEDIDISRRIHANWKTMYWPEVSIIHEHGAASRKNLRMLRIHTVNMIRYFNKWGWLFDRERRSFNSRLLSSVSYLPPSYRPKGRG